MSHHEFTPESHNHCAFIQIIMVHSHQFNDNTANILHSSLAQPKQSSPLNSHIDRVPFIEGNLHSTLDEPSERQTNHNMWGRHQHPLNPRQINPFLLYVFVQWEPLVTMATLYMTCTLENNIGLSRNTSRVGRTQIFVLETHTHAAHHTDRHQHTYFVRAGAITNGTLNETFRVLPIVNLNVVYGFGVWQSFGNENCKSCSRVIWISTFYLNFDSIYIKKKHILNPYSR